MSNGIRISQAGVPVTRAADYQKAMDERWPRLEFLFMGVLDLAVATNTTGAKENAAGTIVYVPLYKHNLGFLPGYRVISISNSGLDNFSGDNIDVSHHMYADETYIYVEVFKSAGVKTIRVKCWLGVMTRNLNTTFLSDVQYALANQTTDVSSYGIKVRNDKGGMYDKQKVHYTTNTNAKSMLIQMHGLITADATQIYGIVLNHNLGYPPSYYLAQLVTGAASADPMLEKTTITPFSSVPTLASNIGNTLKIRGAQTSLGGGQFLYLVLKDPVDVAR